MDKKDITYDTLETKVNDYIEKLIQENGVPQNEVTELFSTIKL